MLNYFCAVEYHTGDLGRMAAGGCLEYLGRKQLQVKVNGEWIDMSTIESALARLDMVAEAAVMVRSDESREPMITAYVVPARGRQPTVSALRRALEAELLASLAPKRWMFLSALPVDGNGKVDRQALPKPSLGRPDLETTYAEPRNDSEKELAACWRQVLRFAAVGVNDNFFDLGGDSLQATVLLRRIGESLGTTISPAMFFESPTVAGVARWLDQRSEPSCLVRIQPQGARLPLFCVSDYDGHVLAHRWLARELSNDQPVFGLQARGIDGQEWPMLCVEDIAAYYLKAVQEVQPHGPYCLAGNCFGGLVAFEMAQQLIARGEPVGLLAMSDTRYPLHPFARVWLAS